MTSDKTLQLINDARNRAISRVNPKLQDLPSWASNFRPHQIVAVKSIMAAFEDNDVVVLDAPTGTGKTLIAETVRRLLNVRALYVCSSKHLQDQFADDYDYAAVLKGRTNYVPAGAVADWAGATCGDCGGDNCSLCEDAASCPYTMAKTRALAEPLAVVNTAYALTEWNSPYSVFSGRGLVIADEADTLEGEMLRYVGVEIGRARCMRYGLSEPAKVTVAASWREWMDSAVPRLVTKRRNVQGNSLRAVREKAYLTRLIGKLKGIAPQLEDGWVYTGKNGNISFKPIRVDELGERTLWRHGRKWLLMSATIISAGDLLTNLGYEANWAAVNVPSVFPKQNRPVIVQPSADMSRKANESTALVRTLLPILGKHRSEHVLLHCVSYQLAEYLHGELVGRCGEIGMGCSTYTGSDGKADALARFGEQGGHLLIAPSLDRGVDLPDEQCRVVIIAKVPYPYLGDRQVNARLHSKGGQVWYNVQTVRSIVQMTGRGVRHEDDWCVSYIIDSQFNNLWSRGRGLFPLWWKEAMEWKRA